MTPYFTDALLFFSLFAVISFIVLAGIVYYRSRYRRAAILAIIDRIEPWYNTSSESRWTKFVRCNYNFRVNHHLFYGNGIVPLRYFFSTDKAGIVFDSLNELSIMQTMEEDTVGDEAIEHALLQKKELIPVTYSIKDPRKNFCTASFIQTGVSVHHHM